MIATITNMGMSMEGELCVTIALPRQHIDDIKALKDETLDVEIKKHHERRSPDSNSYAWVLIGKIAQSMRPPLNKEEVYLTMLKRYGQGGILSIETAKIEAVQRALDYWEYKGNGEVNGKPFTHLMVYIGSSKYDSLEMNIFIEGIVNEAKELGIETATPQQLTQMEDKYKQRYGIQNA